ncbi:MAG: sugar nucleotide-binding protein [Anaerolineae bacterium]|nr:sugar nucleotide-binding protein [Anaerolineae bacterium]
MPTTPRLLVTGGSGYLGRHLTVKTTEIYNVYTTYHGHPNQIVTGQSLPLDLTDRAAVLKLVAEVRPQAIIHAAAINPGSGDEVLMMAVNAEGSRYVAEAAVAVGARLVHISTEMVHDGRHAPYADDAVPSPLQGYGRSKAAAEANVAAVDPRAAIVRTSLIYGLDEMDRGTVGFVARLQAGEELLLFTDVIRQPVWRETLSAALLKLTRLDYSGPLNVVGRQPLSRAEFGRRMLAYWRVETNDLVGEGRGADVSASIPLDLRLTVERGERLLQMPFLGVDEVLALNK